MCVTEGPCNGSVGLGIVVYRTFKMWDLKASGMAQWVKVLSAKL